MTPTDDLTDRLFDDVSWLDQGQEPPNVTSPAVHSVVVPDDALLRYAGLDQHDDSSPTPVTVMITGGAGGLVALAGRRIEGIRIVAVEAMVRDHGDVAGAAARVLIAAESLDESVEVYVGLPPVPGWERAVEPVEAAGRAALVSLTAGPFTLAQQLAVLVEADLPFKIMGGPGRGTAVSAAGAMAAVRALVDDAGPAAAAELIMTAEHFPSPVDAARIRRRLRRLDLTDPTQLRQRT